MKSTIVLHFRFWRILLIMIMFNPIFLSFLKVRLLKQVSQVYQSICFKRLLDLAPFATSFELERVIVDCVRHNDMQVK